MKIGTTSYANRSTRTRDTRSAARGARAGTTGGAEPAGGVEDPSTVLGVDPSELTPHVRDALTKLMDEVTELREELRRAHTRIEYLEELADTDSLTPALNRRAFVRELSRQVSFAERYGTQSAVIYLDVDDMKSVNDTHGHAAGDAVLLHVAEILNQNVRTTDVVGRLGGDEFGVILTRIEDDKATDKARILAQKIMTAPLPWEDHQIRISISFGVHRIAWDDQADEALRAADQAMYSRKRVRAQGASD